MNEVKVKPRVKPVVITGLILVVMIGVCAYLLTNSEVEGTSILGGLVGMFAFLLICVVGGYVRSEIVLSDQGIRTVTALFARPVLYRWKAVDRVLHEGNNYVLYSTQNKWIGAIDVRNPKAEAALDMLTKHKIRMKEIRSDQ